MVKTMQCLNPKCGKRTSSDEAQQRNYRTGDCAHCGWGLAEVVAGLPNDIAQKLDVIFNETYLPIQVRTDLEKLIVEYGEGIKNGQR